jgi:hypothetical protein
VFAFGSRYGTTGASDVAGGNTGDRALPSSGS